MAEGKERPNREQRAAKRFEEVMAQLNEDTATEEMNMELNANVAAAADLAVAHASRHLDLVTETSDEAATERRQPNKRFGEIQGLLKPDEWKNLIGDLKALQLHFDGDTESDDAPAEEQYLELGALLRGFDEKQFDAAVPIPYQTGLLLAGEVNYYGVSEGNQSDPLRFLQKAYELKMLNEDAFNKHVKFSAPQWDAIVKAIQSGSGEMPQLLSLLAKAFELDKDAIMARMGIEPEGWAQLVDYIMEYQGGLYQPRACLVAAAQSIQPEGMKPDIRFTNKAFDDLLDELAAILKDRQTEYVGKMHKFLAAAVAVKYIKIIG